MQTKSTSFAPHLPVFAIAVVAGNSAPKISGVPSISATVGTAYSFAPTASDANGDTLTFSIQNRPVWATFNASTGKLSGTPTSAQVGNYATVVIGVSDGKVSASLPAFSISVASANPEAPGTVTLSWAAPTLREDGTGLVSLAGYRIHFGTTIDALHDTVQIDNLGLTRYVLQNLAAGTYHFSITAFDSSGNISVLSNTMMTTVQ